MGILKTFLMDSVQSVLSLVHLFVIYFMLKTVTCFNFKICSFILISIHIANTSQCVKNQLQ